MKVRADTAFMRVSAQDVKASVDSPEFDRATMDGFAVRSFDTEVLPAVLKCVETIPAGRVPKKSLKKGECARIATGAMLPEGADSVVMKEAARMSSSGLIILTGRAAPKENIVFRAQDLKKGDVILAGGDVLGASNIGLLSSQGVEEVAVYSAPRIALLATGDEIAEPGKEKRAGQIWNASASMLRFAIRRWQLETDYLGIIRDDPERILKKIRQGLKSDIFIITGAVSVGDFDLVPAALKRSGAVVKFHKVAIRPGKPLLFAVKRGCFIFGLPGNPVSSFVSFLLFVEPLIKKMLGFGEDDLTEKGFLTKSVYNKSDRLSLFPGVLERNGGRISIRPVKYSGSADLAAVSNADVLFMVEKNKYLSGGSIVEFFRIRV